MEKIGQNGDALEPPEKIKKGPLNSMPKKEDQTATIGAVSWRVYLKYLAEMGCHWASLFIVFLGL